MYHSLLEQSLSSCKMWRMLTNRLFKSIITNFVLPIFLYLCIICPILSYCVPCCLFFFFPSSRIMFPIPPFLLQLYSPMSFSYSGCVSSVWLQWPRPCRLTTWTQAVCPIQREKPRWTQKDTLTPNLWLPPSKTLTRE